MPAVQSLYPATMRPYVVGMVQNQETANTTSLAAVEDAAGIAFGVAAFRGTTDKRLTATPAAGKFRGITVRDITQQALSPTANQDFYPQYSTPSLLTMGRIPVNVSVAVNQEDDVYVTNTGAFTNVPTATVSTNVKCGQFKFDTTLTAAGIGLIARR
jgi:hypothetical protein